MKVIVVIPTYNEFEVLNECLNYLYNQKIDDLIIYIINAGNPIPFPLSDNCIVYSVDNSFFWSHAVEYGFQKIRELLVSPDFVFLINADIVIMPNNGLMQLLDVAMADKDKRTIVSVPVYKQEGNTLKLVYTHTQFKPLLGYRFLVVPWTFIEEAPQESFQVELIGGGQGVLIPFYFIKENKIDITRFPQYEGDIDYWMTAKKSGYKMMIVPTVSAVEIRLRGGEIHKARRSFTFKNLFDVYNPFSLTVHWNFFRKHDSYPKAILSIIIYFVGRLFNIIRRKMALLNKYR